jgi:hypothetical protein
MNMAYVKIKANKKTYEFELNNKSTKKIQREVITFLKDNEGAIQEMVSEEFIRIIIRESYQTDKKMTDELADEIMGELIEADEIIEASDGEGALYELDFILFKTLFAKAKGYAVQVRTPRKRKTKPKAVPTETADEE